MIADKDTNTIYLSELITTNSLFVETSEQIIYTLKAFGANYKLLPNTNDIWARDYMPIQINDNQYIEFRFDPDYLQGKGKGYRDLKTYPDIVCDSLKIKTQKTDIIMDGGNFVKSSDCVILTDKIVAENKNKYSKSDLIKKLHDTFEVDKVVIIPRDEDDVYGHSDGMVRFIDNNTVLISHYYKDFEPITNPIKKAGLRIEYINFNMEKKDNSNWAYLNFLQTKDIILIPKLGIDDDEQALKQIESFYPDYKGYIAQIEMTEIVKKGGALNCITWTTKEKTLTP